MQISDEITQWHWRKQRLLTYVLNGATVFISGQGWFSLLQFGFKVFQRQLIDLFAYWLTDLLIIYLREHLLSALKALRNGKNSAVVSASAL